MRTGSDVKSRFNSLSVARQPPPEPKYISFVTLGPLERQKTVLRMRTGSTVRIPWQLL